MDATQLAVDGLKQDEMLNERIESDGTVDGSGELARIGKGQRCLSLTSAKEKYDALMAGSWKKTLG